MYPLVTQATQIRPGRGQWSHEVPQDGPFWVDSRTGTYMGGAGTVHAHTDGMTGPSG